MALTVEIGRREAKIFAGLTLLVLLIAAGTATINVRDSGPFNLFTVLDMNDNQIENIGAPDEDSDAATRQYVDQNRGASFSDFNRESETKAVGKAGSAVITYNLQEAYTDNHIVSVDTTMSQERAGIDQPVDARVLNKNTDANGNVVSIDVHYSTDNYACGNNNCYKIRLEIFGETA